MIDGVIRAEPALNESLRKLNEDFPNFDLIELTEPDQDVSAVEARYLNLIDELFDLSDFDK